VGTHYVEKFGAILPKYPDNIIQSTPDFWHFQILGIKKLLGADPCPMRYALASVGQWSSFTNCEIFRGQRPLAPEI